MRFGVFYSGERKTATMNPRNILRSLLSCGNVECNSDFGACGGASQRGRIVDDNSVEVGGRTFESGTVDYENHRWNFALRDWNEAVKLDPKFARAYVRICFTTNDPAEEARDRARAKALMQAVTLFSKPRRHG